MPTGSTETKLKRAKELAQGAPSGYIRARYQEQIESLEQKLEECERENAHHAKKFVERLLDEWIERVEMGS